MRRLLIPLFALTVLTASAEDPKPAAVSFTELEDRLRVEFDGELFTEYRFNDSDRFFPAFYPLVGPGGTKMTRRFPFEENTDEDTDHPHHQSLWFAHSDVNGYTFWATREYKGRKPGHTVHQKFLEKVEGEEGGYFVAANNYEAPDGSIVMTDTRKVEFLGTADARILDITITFNASNGDVSFNDEKDAGMAIRVASELQVTHRTKVNGKAKEGTGHLINSEGIRDVETWGKRARWVHSYGEVGGQKVGVVIMDHPTNPRYPTYWHSRDYGLVTANIYGKHFFEKLKDPQAGAMKLPNGESRTFRWRFVFHQGEADTDSVEAYFKQFAGE
jgi:hypothetical protein